MDHGIGYKTSETLLGIETSLLFAVVKIPYCYKTSETLLGIETVSVPSAAYISGTLQNL